MTTLRPNAIARLVLLAATVVLAACGQRGDLYLPAPQKSAIPAVSAPCTDPAATDPNAPATHCPKD